jgi:glycyl-tRNA synthetase
MEIEFFYDDTNPQCDILYERCSDERLNILRAEDRERGNDKPIQIRVAEAVEEKIIMSPWLAYWMCIAKRFVNALGVPDDKMYFEEKLAKERAHYSKQTFDQMVIVDKWGKLEVSGHAYRHTYDLERHIMFSKADLYAIRQLKEPKTVTKTIIEYDKNAILSIFGSKAPQVFKALAKLSQEDLAKILSQTNSDTVTINGIEVPRSVFRVRTVEEKIWVERFVPHVSEPSFGVERLMYVVLEYAYTEDEKGRVVMRFPRRLAPIKVGVTPLVDREPLESIARRIYNELKQHYYTIYLEGGSIGKKYAHADELGVPFVITVDYDTPQRNDVTVRDRDTKKQVRVPISDVIKVIDAGLSGTDITTLGYPVIEYREDKE